MYCREHHYLFIAETFSAGREEKTRFAFICGLRQNMKRLFHQNQLRRLSLGLSFNQFFNKGSPHLLAKLTQNETLFRRIRERKAIYPPRWLKPVSNRHPAHPTRTRKTVICSLKWRWRELSTPKYQYYGSYRGLLKESFTVPPKKAHSDETANLSTHDKTRVKHDNRQLLAFFKSSAACLSPLHLKFECEGQLATRPPCVPCGRSLEALIGFVIGIDGCFRTDHLMMWESNKYPFRALHCPNYKARQAQAEEELH